MIGSFVVLTLPDDIPVRTNHRTTFRTGDIGQVVEAHPRWHAWVVQIKGVRAVFFPDELQEIH